MEGAGARGARSREVTYSKESGEIGDSLGLVSGPGGHSGANGGKEVVTDRHDVRKVCGEGEEVSSGDVGIGSDSGADDGELGLRRGQLNAAIEGPGSVLGDERLEVVRDAVEGGGVGRGDRVDRLVLGEHSDDEEESESNSLEHLYR